MALQRRGGYTQDGPTDLTDNTLVNPVMGGNLGAAAGGLGQAPGVGQDLPTPDPGAAPGAPPGAPPPGVLGPGGNTDGPRELNPGAANPDVSRVGGGGGGAQGTPARPASPEPVSSQPPSPFEPIAPGMSDQASATPDVGRVNPFGGPATAGSGLYGKAGGLLGGGLGVPGTNPDHGNDPSNNPDILTLLKLLGAGGQ